MLIGLDGATFSVLDDLGSRGVMPFFQELLRTGARAELMSTVPPLTPPAWTSLATGRSPGHHGVFDFVRRVAPGGHSVGFATARDLGAETLWSLVSRCGKRVTVLNYPITYPPPAVDGYVIAGWMPWRMLALGCYPADLLEQLGAVPGFDPRELGMDLDLEEQSLEGGRPEEYADWVGLHMRRERQWANVLGALTASDPCDLTAVVFDGVDKLQHLCWRWLHPAKNGQEPWEAALRERLQDYFRALDEILAEIVSRAPSDTTFLFVSDHGFGAQIGTFFVNAWLEERGYLRWAEDRPEPAADEKVFGVRHTGQHTRLFDWAHTRAYAPTVSGYAIHIALQGPDTPGGVPVEEYESFREELREELLGFRAPGVETPIVARVWRREEAFAGPYMHLAPDLTLQLSDGGLPSILPAAATFAPRAQPIGAHRPEGIFLARGPGIRAGVSLAPLSLLDMAPLVLGLLGLPIPPDMEGRFPAEMFVSAPEVEVGECDQPFTPPPTSYPELDAESERLILERLRALGYME